MFQSTAKPSFKKDFKKVRKSHKKIEAEVLSIMNELIQGKRVGIPLKGNLKGAHKVSFGRKPEMRLIYVVGECDSKTECAFGVSEREDHVIAECGGVISFLWLKTREECNNHYKFSKRQMGDFLSINLTS